MSETSSIPNFLELFEQTRSESTKDVAGESIQTALQDPDVIFPLFDILANSEISQYDRMYARICIDIILKNMTEFNEEYIGRVKAAFMEIISAEEDIVLLNNIVHTASKLFTKLRDSFKWDELVELAGSLLTTEGKLNVALTIYLELQCDAKAILPPEQQQCLFEIVMTNLSNENVETRILCANLLNQLFSDDVQLDPVRMIQFLMECAHKAMYEVGDEREVRALCNTIGNIYEDPFFDHLFDDPRILAESAEAFLAAMQDDSLAREIRIHAANTATQGSMKLFDQLTPEKMEEYLNVAISFSLFLVQEEYESRQFEYMREFIWQLASSAKNGDIFFTSIKKVEELMSEDSIENRLVSLSIIMSVVEGSKEYIINVIEHLVDTVNQLGDCEDEFVLSYACEVYLELIELIPHELECVVNPIMDFLVAHFPGGRTPQTIICLLNSVKRRPDCLSDLLESLTSELTSSEDEEAQETLLYCISSCFAYPNEPNEEIFAQYAPMLVELIGSNDGFKPSCEEMFRRMIKLCPASTESDIEAIITLAVESLESEDIKTIEAGLKLIDEFVTFLPISMAPYLENVYTALEQVRETHPFNFEATTLYEDDELYEVHASLLRCFGHLISSYPTEIAEKAEDLIGLLAKAAAPASILKCAACEALTYACEGFKLIEGLSATLISIGFDITTYMKTGCPKTSFIVAYFELARKIILACSEDLASDNGPSFTYGLTAGLSGELPSFLLSELSTCLDVTIQKPFFDTLITLLFAENGQNESVVTTIVSAAKSYLSNTGLQIASLSSNMFAIISLLIQDKEEIYNNAFITSQKELRSSIGPIATEAVLNTIENLIRSDKGLFIQHLGVEVLEFLNISERLICAFNASPFMCIKNASASLYATIIVEYEITEIKPEPLQLMLSLLPPPIDTFYVMTCSSFIAYMFERIPEVIEPVLAKVAVYTLASQNFFIRRLAPSSLELYVQRVQAIDQPTIMSILKGNQYLFMRLSRNIEALST